MKFFNEDESIPPEGLAADSEEAQERSDLESPVGELDSNQDDSKRQAQLATFLNCQLMAISGFWIGAVPTAAMGFGSAIGGWTGGTIFTALLAVSAQLFLSNHPTFPYNAYLRSYGWEIVRRKDSRKTYLMVLRPSSDELSEIESVQHMQLEADRERIEEYRERRRERILQKSEKSRKVLRRYLS